jgi:hypothetical protein
LRGRVKTVLFTISGKKKSKGIFIIHNQDSREALK